MNEITKLQVGNKFPAIGDLKGSSKMAGHTWFWIRTTKELKITKKVREISFQIYSDEERKKKLTQLMGNVKNVPTP